MYLVLIAWLYVALMMAVAEATSPVGSWLGALFTFLLYGILPMVVVAYIMGTPARRRAIKAREMASATPDTNGETASDAITSIRKEP
jgi:hypothetical protein